MKTHPAPFLLRRIFILFTLLAAFGANRLCMAAYFDPKLHWQTISTQHFNIHFHDGEQEVALRMADITERVYENLSPKINWKPWGRTEVILTDHTDISNAFATTLPYNYMLLYITSPEGTSTLNYYDDWLEDLFTHEFTHILHIDKYGGIAKPFRWVLGKIITPNGLTPGWVREGIAVYDESQRGKGRVNNSFSEMMLRTDILNDQFLFIDEMSGLKIDWPSANAAYIYGGAFWQYLADTYGGWDKIKEFIQRYGDSMWLFSLNNKARKTFDDKNFVKLWREWKESLQKKYGKIKEELTAKGLTNLTTLVHIDGTLLAPTVSPDGKTLVYAKTDVYKAPELRKLDLTTKENTLLAKGRATGQITFSPDGKKIAYGSLGGYKRYYTYYDLYELDLETKKLSTLTRGKRASDPDYSPDGKSIVYVGTKGGGSQLFLLDRESKKETVLTHAPAYTRFSNPRFSPDGKKIAVSAWMNGDRDIYIYNLDGAIDRPLTQDKAIDNEPRWSGDGKWVYFSSDRSGIPNIYRQSASGGAAEPLTNVLTGLFHPQSVPNAQKLTAQHYYGRGYDIVQFDEAPIPAPAAEKIKTVWKTKKVVRNGKVRWVRVKQKSTGAPATEITSAEKDLSSVRKMPESQPSVAESGTSSPYKIEPYGPFKNKKVFIPRYIMPGFLFLDGAALFSATIGSSDPLGRHIWLGDVTYRTDANFLGGDILYTYNRWTMPFYLGFDDYVVNFGDIFRINKNFFEQRRRVYAGTAYTKGRHRLDFYYSFEHHSDASGLPPGSDQVLNFGRFAGFGGSYTFTRVSKYPKGISLEGGPRFRLSLEIFDKIFGSSERNETKIVEGDLREYIHVPGTKSHVIALRATAGANFGDQLFQGVFRLGSSIGEGTLVGYTPRLYPLRGLPEITFAGDRAMLFSGEYRIPIYSVQRGITTLPIHLNNIHLALFSDLGTVFNGSPHWNEFLLGVGAELRGDFILGYGLPITGRLGYGIIVKGREFISGLTDPITGASIKNGALILSLGTSF